MRISISMRRLLSGGLALFLAGPAAAFAHASEGQLGLFLLSLVAGVLLPPLLLAAAFHYLPPWLPATPPAEGEAPPPPTGVRTSTGVVFVVALLVWCALIMAFFAQRWLQQRRSSEQHVAQRQQESRDLDQAWQQLPLRVAACAGDLAGVRALMAAPAAAKPVHELDEKVRLARECAIERPQPEVLGLLLDDAVYRDAERPGGAEAIAKLVFQTLDLELLSALMHKRQDGQLPLSDSSALRLWQQVLLESHQRSPEQKLAWLRALRAQGLDLRQGDAAGMSLLQLAFETQAAPLIEYALSLGSDPYASRSYRVDVKMPRGQARGAQAGDAPEIRVESYSWSPLQSWTLRKFGFVERAEDRRRLPPLSEAEIAAIERQLRPLQPQEAALRRGSYALRTEMPDGGAALLAHMLERGVQLDIADAAGQGLIQADKTYTPQLLAVLAGLSDAQLQQLNCPVHARSSLQLRADVANNQALLAVLAGRTLRRCAANGKAGA